MISIMTNMKVSGFGSKSYMALGVELLMLSGLRMKKKLSYVISRYSYC